MYNTSIGKYGEEVATSYLKDQGYQIRHRNYTCRWGELDIIAEKDNKITFVEVKTRIGNNQGKAYEKINYYKVKHLQRTIQYYLLQYKLYKVKLQLDVIAIQLSREKELLAIQHYENVMF